MTGAVAQGHVGAMTEKSLRRAARRKPQPSLCRWAELIELTEGSWPRFLALAGAERIAVLNDDHYSGVLYGKAQGLERVRRALPCLPGWPARIDMFRFERSLDPDAFPLTIAAAAAHIRDAPA